MSRITKFAWLLTTIVILSLTACGGGETATPTVDAGAVYTAAVEAAYSQLTQTALAVTNTPESTPTATATAATVAVENTNTALPTELPTNTPLVALTALPTNTPFSLTPIVPTQQSCDNFLFITDVTVPDGSHMNPGEKFDKTWKVQNTGPCSWNKDYLIAFAYGNPNDPVAWMGNQIWYSISSTTVNPGTVLEITIPLQAPTDPGDYFGAWRLQNDRGTKFGIFLTVKITVP